MESRFGPRSADSKANLFQREFLEIASSNLKTTLQSTFMARNAYSRPVIFLKMSFIHFVLKAGRWIVANLEGIDEMLRMN